MNLRTNEIQKTYTDAETSIFFQKRIVLFNSSRAYFDEDDLNFTLMEDLNQPFIIRMHMYICNMYPRSSEPHDNDCYYIRIGTKNC